ncbi:Disease resistance protein RPM1, partial [Bienertia sinuspersici]
GLASIKNELQIITAFLKDAEDRAERIEDVIDEHVMLTYIRLQNQQSNNWCLSIPCIIKELKLYGQLATSIANIKIEVAELQQRKASYGLLMREQHTDTDTDTIQILIFGDKRCKMLGHIDCWNWRNRENYLAWKVYDNVEVKRHFYVRAWVNVTQFYSTKDVLRSMLRGFYKSTYAANSHSNQ